MPISVAYALGYCLASVSPSVTVPALIQLNNNGYGKKKGIPLMMVAAGTYEDIIAIIMFGACK